MDLWQSLIVCDAVPNPGGLPLCSFGSLVTLVNVLIHDMVVLSTFLATGVIAYAGFLLLKSGGDPGAMTKAREIFRKVIFGYLWILAAWVIVYTITHTLLKGGYSLLE